MGQFCQRVGLVHELRKLVGTKERVDDRGKGTCVDQVYWLEIFVVTHVHSLTDGTGHSGQTYTKLAIQLLAYGTYTTVGQVVNIIDYCTRVDQTDQVLHNRNDVFFGQNNFLWLDCQAQFFVDSVASYFTQVVTLVGEEQTLNHLSRSSFVRSFGITKLTVNHFYGLFFRVGVVFLKCVVDDGEIGHVYVLPVEDDGLGA